MVPEISLPKLGREVEIPVYLIHNSVDAEDYFFIFDFEQFEERSREGVFARPKLKIRAGWEDFSRRTFARSFREAFAREFEVTRAAQAAGSGKARGWFGWGWGAGGLDGLVAAFVVNVLLLVATSAGSAVWKGLGLDGLWRGKSDTEKLEVSIAQTQGPVDAALELLEIRLHIELYRHAWRGGAPGPLKGMDYEAWPLPASISRHLAG